MGNVPFTKSTRLLNGALTNNDYSTHKLDFLINRNNGRQVGLRCQLAFYCLSKCIKELAFPSLSLSVSARIEFVLPAESAETKLVCSQSLLIAVDLPGV